jgi:hypothetical protein
MDPSKFQTAQQWQNFFREQNVHWVVRSPDYPATMAAPLEELEEHGELVPIARTDVSDFHGLRISGQRNLIPVVIYQVKR